MDTWLKCIDAIAEEYELELSLRDTLNIYIAYISISRTGHGTGRIIASKFGSYWNGKSWDLRHNAKEYRTIHEFIEDYVNIL